MQNGPQEQIIAQLCNDLKSIQKTRDSYIDKYGKKRFSRMNRRVWRTKLDEITDLVAPATPVDGRHHTRRKRKELASSMHEEIKLGAYQATFPLMDEVSSSVAEIVPFQPVSLREQIKQQVCPELDRLEAKFGGINRQLIRQRVLFGCDAE